MLTAATLAGAVSWLASPTVVNGQTAAYSIIDLDIRVGQNSAASGINNAGQVVGYLSTSATTAGRATLFGGPNFTTTTLEITSGVSSDAYAINDAGQIVGRLVNSTSQHATMWSFNGSVVTTTNLAPDNAVTDAYGINNAGLVVGDILTSSVPERAVAFLVNGVTVTRLDLGTNGGKDSLAISVNAAGTIAGFADTPNETEHATLFRVNGTSASRTDLNATVNPSDDNVARGSNTVGQVVGTRYSDDDSRVHGMIWNVNSSPVTTQDVGFLGGTRCFPQAINNAGQVVGNADTTASGNSQHAFLYTAAGGLKDINTLVGTSPIASNIILGSVYGLYGSPLNEWGQIAATGTVNGHFHALRLDPKTPLSSVSNGVLDCKIIAGSFYQYVAGFKDPNDAGSAVPNAFSLLSGTVGYGDRGSTSGQNRDVTIASVANPAVPPIVGNAINLQGTGGDTLVVQIVYNSATATALFGTENNARLGWYNGTRWVNAVDANGPSSGQVGGFVGYRSYDQSTDILLGTHGVDPKSHNVWAVVDHGGLFGVILDPAALQKTKVFSRNGTVATLTADGYTGHIYQLQRAAALTTAGDAFVNAGAVKTGSTGTSLVFTNDDGTATQGFYRLKIDP